MVGKWKLSAKSGRKGKLTFFPYVGGKFYMLDVILKLIPEHNIYVEVFGGSAKVLLNKPPSKIEIYNDYDMKIANLFYVVAFKFEEFYEKINWLVYSRAIRKQVLEEYRKTELKELGDIDLAVKTYYLLRTAFGGKFLEGSWGYAFTRSEARKFFNSLETLQLIHERLKNVQIECRDFRRLLSKVVHRENAFIYLDPPYYGAEHYYDTGFSEQDHRDLLNIIKQAEAKWLLSGYANPLYDEELKDFYRLEIPAVKYVYGITKQNRTENRPRTVEVLWANYDITKQVDLIAGPLYNSGMKEGH
jgi:DNA adenine methylase